MTTGQRQVPTAQPQGTVAAARQGTAAQQGTVAAQPASQNNTVMKRMQEETVNSVLDRVNVMQESGELVLPRDYNAGNALKSAWLYLQTIEDSQHVKVTDKCTRESICNCLLEMVIKGEYPKQHCYFIPYGNSLEFEEKYTGRLMRAKRDTEIKRVNAQVVYEGDVFTYTVDDNGEYQFVSHQTDIANIDIAKIKCAYAVVINKDGSRHLEIMTMDQIRKSWQQGATKGVSKAHTNFTDQMCKKTVIGRACKIALDSASDGGNDDFSMTPPDAAEAERNQAQEFHNAVEAKNGGASTGKLLEDAAEYVDVSTGEMLRPSPQQQAATAERECPI